MSTINLIFLSKDRPIQLRNAICSALLNMETCMNIKIKIIFDSNSPHEYTIGDARLLFERLNSHLEIIKDDISSSKFNVYKYLVENELNLILPDNACFSLNFKLDDIFFLDIENEYLDLSKGINRQQDVNSNFKFDSASWEPFNSLYKIKENQVIGGSYKDLYGKVFLKNKIDISSKSCYFFPISPFFINTINFVETIDDVDLSEGDHNSTYALAVRAMVEETIDTLDYQSYCPNKLYDFYNFSFKFNKGYSFSNYFKNIFYINLDERVDRKVQIENHLNSLGIRYERFSAIVPSELEVDSYIKSHPNFNENDIRIAKGRLGCMLSHLSIIKKAKDLNLERVLILEDDCEFLINPQDLFSHLASDMDLLPKYDMLYFGANSLTNIKMLSPNIGKLNGSYCTHAYCIPNHFYDTILSYNENVYKAIDEWYFDICRDSRYNCYTVLPLIATQFASYSDVELKNVDYYNVIIDSYKRSLS